MKILLLGLNYAPEPIGIGPYTTGLAEALAQAGHEVRVIAGNPYYPQWRALAGQRGWRRQHEGMVQVDRVPHFIPKAPGGFGRLLQQASFALAAAPGMFIQALVWRPHRVIAIAPGLMAAPVALAAARIAGATAWLHVQDFELEAAQATGLMPRTRLIVRGLESLERALLGAFDRVSTISPSMCRRLMQKGVRREAVSEQRNWAAQDLVSPLGRPSRFRSEWNITTPHVALYAGALGHKQGTELVVAAARRLAHRTELTFVLCGNGPHRSALERQAEGLANIRFHDLQPAEHLSELLGLATMHILPLIAGAADLVLPSKLPNMLASGRPVIATAAKGTGLFDEIHGCGLAVEPGSIASLCAGIERLIAEPVLAEDLGRAARRRAELRWHRETILAGFVGAIEEAGEPQPAPQMAREHV